MSKNIYLRVDKEKVNSKNPPDFYMYYSGGHIIDAYGIEGLYSRENQINSQRKLLKEENLLREGENFEGLLAFRVPPVTAFLLRPLSTLSYSHAYLVMLAINLFLLSVFVFVCYSSNILNKKNLIPFLVLLPFFTPIWENLYGGQISILLLFIITLSYIVLRKNSLFMAGVILGFLAIKPNFLLLPFWVLIIYLAHIKWKYLFFGLVLSLSLMVFGNVLLYGNDFFLDYSNFLFISESSSYGTSVAVNHNISSILSLFFDSHRLINSLNVLINISILAYVVSFLRTRKEYVIRERAVMWAIMFTPLLNLHTMPGDLVVILLPILVFAKFLKEEKKRNQLYFFVFGSVFSTWLVYVGLPQITTILLLIFAFWFFYQSFDNSELFKAEKNIED